MSILNVRRTRDILTESGAVDEDHALELAVALDEELTEGAVPRAGVEAQLSMLDAKMDALQTRMDAHLAKLDAHQARMDAHQATLDAKMDAHQERIDAHQARTDAKLAEMAAENERRMNRLQLFILGTGAAIIAAVGALMAAL